MNIPMVDSCRRGLALLGLGAALSLSFSTPVRADGHERAGTALSWALPAGVAGYELYQGDREGALQFGKAFVVTLGATEVLKRTTGVDRPNGKDDDAFPSGHAARAFSAAAYVHRRHGIEAAWPMYLAAGYVGWTRVHADEHRWRDVLGGAALSAAATWWLVDPKQERRVTVLPLIGPHGAGVEVSARW
ncbi:phosphatase PAP2 family protein [uncultured Azohydromonas sp.]|uniref:phosphatase PAP2 family protein n=1 Tax=uncultured Azohydromonas sp. TaxID=487342 RepID=UPI002610CDA7|nr:phosphatase PAP2 family protein [uncultured Azohydromonas sp.]